ncbi:vacuolar trafficking protein, partial [Haematococcus lacustris]
CGCLAPSHAWDNGGVTWCPCVQNLGVGAHVRQRCAAAAAGVHTVAQLVAHGLTGIMYILVPMPFIFFGSSQGNDGYALSGSSMQSGWADAGKFLTGFSAVGSIAIPAILAHAQVITIGALVMELAAALVLGGTVLVQQAEKARQRASPLAIADGSATAGMQGGGWERNCFATRVATHRAGGCPSLACV